MNHRPKLSLLLASLVIASSFASPQKSSDPTVYGTNSGHKYHRDGSSYLRKSKIEMKLTEAVKRGLTPCSKCKPPTK